MKFNGDGLTSSLILGEASQAQGASDLLFGVPASIVSAVISAIVAGVVAALVARYSASSQASLQAERLRAELKTEFMAEEAIRQLLSTEQWNHRSFRAIQGAVRGFDDDELRRLLVRSGALCFGESNGKEWWGLRSRNGDTLRATAERDSYTPAPRQPNSG